MDVPLMLNLLGFFLLVGPCCARARFRFAVALLGEPASFSSGFHQNLARIHLTERVICRVLLVPDVCEKLIQQLTLHRSDPLHVCGRLGLCTKGCPCGRCTAQTRGHCLAEEADRCAQPRSPRASAQQPAQPAKPTQACPAGACGDVNTTDCCLHC